MKRISILFLILVFAIDANAQQSPSRPYRYFLELGLHNGSCGMYAYSKNKYQPYQYSDDYIHFPMPTGLNAGFVVGSGQYQARLGLVYDAGDENNYLAWREYSLAVGKVFFPSRFVSFDVNAGLAYQTIGYEIYHSPSVPGFRGSKEYKINNQLGLMLDANCKFVLPYFGFSLGFYLGFNSIGYNGGISFRTILGKVGHTKKEWSKYKTVALNQEK